MPVDARLTARRAAGEGGDRLPGFLAPTSGVAAARELLSLNAHVGLPGERLDAVRYLDGIARRSIQRPQLGRQASQLPGAPLA